jgi:LruC domain-containing protein
MKTIHTIILLVSILFVGCENRDRKDLAFVWLSTILLQAPTADSGVNNTTQTPNVDPGGNNTTQALTNDKVTSLFSMTVNDVSGNKDFLFNSLEQVSVQISIQDSFNNGVTPVVRILQYTDPIKMTLFQAIPDANGSVKGSFTYDVNKPHAVLEVNYNGQTYAYEIDLTGVTELNRLIRINGVVSTVAIVDTDGDGVSDLEDEFPNDPTRTSTVKTPSDTYTTVAYEDLYPKQGDADFNDYVVRVWNEEDLDSLGRVKRIRGTYEHVAKGAGYNHILYIRTPSKGTYSLKRFTSTGQLESSIQQNFTNDIEILPNSSTTLSASNTAKGQTMVKGKKAELEVIFDEPIDRKLLGIAPFDLFIKVINTGHEIHFLGKYKNTDGTDKYLDSNGFPWAISIPGAWKHPYEKTDIRNSYTNFKPWYESKGANFTDWFQTPNANYVFPVVE